MSFSVLHYHTDEEPPYYPYLQETQHIALICPDFTGHHRKRQEFPESLS